jgi:hypothetical protein
MQRRKSISIFKIDRKFFLLGSSQQVAFGGFQLVEDRHRLLEF